MASESKRKSNKQATITFTLPLSCQICLGKVKQPVLCPNHHVFCQLCMDIWLEKNRQCPTCRVDINDNNPVKNIIGGQVEEEDGKKHSSAELRRARFELLYKEYEDQFDQMRKESIILRTENNILLAQLQDAEDKNDEQVKAEKDAKGSSSGKNEPNLLMLTRNLQEAQTLYVGIKDEMTQLKQENSKLKDENVNLTRENENLRLEIAQRSPKKFGRYTVATLETKLSEYEKEIRQLKRALERSDEYVEDLEKQIEKLSGSRHEQHEQKLNGVQKNALSKALAHSEKNGHVYANGKEPLTEESGDANWKVLRPSGYKNEVLLSQDRESARRILFSLCAEDKSSQQSENGVSKVGSESCNDNGEATQHVRYPDSIMKHGGGGESSHKQYDGNDMNGKMPKMKRVQFNLTKSANSSASFELEMPSPYGGNGGPQMSGEKESKTKDNDIDNNGDEIDGLPPSTDFDTHVVSLLRKANVSSHNGTHNGYIPERKLTNSEDLISTNKATDHNSIPKKNSSRLRYEDSNDSSRLSLPDLDSSPKVMLSYSDGVSDSPGKQGLSSRDGLLELDDTDDKTDEKLSHNKTELDISMTPEMSDCLRLLNQAERKLEMPPTNVYSDRGMNLQSSLKPNPALVQVTNSLSASSKAPPVSYKSSFKPHTFASSDSMKSWEQEFFRGLHANPYKPYKFNNNPSSLASMTSDNSKELHGNSVQNGLPASLHDDFSSFKKSHSIPHNAALTNTNTSALSSYQANQESSYSSFPSNSKLPYDSGSNTHGGGLYSKSNSNPLMSHFDKLQPFTGSIPISLSSSDHPHAAGSSTSNQNTLDRRPVGSIRAPTPPPGFNASSSSNLFSVSNNPSNYLLSSTSSSSKDLHNGLYSSSHSINPSSGTSHTHTSFRNPLPPSLNNSSLEWPDSPVKSFRSSDPNDIPGSYSSNDVLPQTSSHRDRNRFTSLTSSSSPRNLNRGGSQDFMFTSANSSFSSDPNNSSFLLPEPKKRLFHLDDDLDLPTSKTAKK